MGPATQAVGAVPIRQRRPSLPAVAFALLLSILTACGGSDAEQAPSPTTSPTGLTTRTATASPTIALGAPQFDSARALEHARVLSVDIGIRAAGTEGERQGAYYIRDQLSGYGYDTSLQPFPFETFVGQTSLELLSPETRVIEAVALGRSAAGSAEDELIDAGLGRPEDFPADSSGKIAVIKRGVLFFHDKVSNAERAGATAVIIFNNQSGMFQGSLNDASTIPAVSISEEDGRVLLDLMLSALTPRPVAVRLDVQTETISGQSQNVVARSPEGQCRLVIGGHYDSVPEGPGANDNASGTSVIIELARVLAGDGEFDDVCFALFGSEEIGLFGSAAYVSALTAGEKSEIEGMLNFDMLSVGDGWPLSGSLGVADVAGAEAERLGLSYSVETALPEQLGSDHQNFIEAGIPAMIFNCFCDERYHTADDRFEFVEEARLEEAGSMALGTIAALLND